MAVVINEFEAVPPDAPVSEESAKKSGDSAKSKEKQEPERLLRLWQERHNRVRAH